MGSDCCEVCTNLVGTSARDVTDKEYTVPSSSSFRTVMMPDSVPNQRMRAKQRKCKLYNRSLPKCHEVIRFLLYPVTVT